VSVELCLTTRVDNPLPVRSEPRARQTRFLRSRMFRETKVPLRRPESQRCLEGDVFSRDVAGLTQEITECQRASLFVSAGLNNVNMMRVRPFSRAMKERAHGIVNMRHMNVAERGERHRVGTEELQRPKTGGGCHTYLRKTGAGTVICEKRCQPPFFGSSRRVRARAHTARVGRVARASRVACGPRNRSRHARPAE
jgi:hypothetical protein